MLASHFNFVSLNKRLNEILIFSLENSESYYGLGYQSQLLLINASDIILLILIIFVLWIFVKGVEKILSQI